MITEIRERFETAAIDFISPYLVNAGPAKKAKNLERIDLRSKSRTDDIYLSDEFDLTELLACKKWVNTDMAALKKSLSSSTFSKSDFLTYDKAFSLKYGSMIDEDDARFVCKDWFVELDRALMHINERAKKGIVLHIGCDEYLESRQIHTKAKKVILSDISATMLMRAFAKCPYATVNHSSADQLAGIGDGTVDFVVALRVFCSYDFNKNESINKITQKLRVGGSILLSVSNGYRGLDDTILPGQIVGDHPKLNLTKPFREALHLTDTLFSRGFRELFVVTGSTEIFVGGTYLSSAKLTRSQQVLHMDDVGNVPLCFYSEKMPTGWLGNFSSHPVLIDGVKWKTAEHYFQAQKFIDPELQRQIEECEKPAEAKAFAWTHSYRVRTDWENIKVELMRFTLRNKFHQHENLKTALHNTKKRLIIERSANDSFWGENIKGTGANLMGILLMDIREE